MGQQATRHTELSLFRLQIEMAKWHFRRYKNAKLKCAGSWYAVASVLDGPNAKLYFLVTSLTYFPRPNCPKCVKL